MLTVIFLAFLQAPVSQHPENGSSDTAGVFHALGSELRAKLEAPITVRFDSTTCDSTQDSPCNPSFGQVSAHPLLEPLFDALGDKGRRSSTTTTECRNYESGPFDLSFRLPRFDGDRATVLVTMSCRYPGCTGRICVAFAKGEQFEFQFERAWRLVARHLVWIT
jgi:hypothetical protein